MWRRKCYGEKKFERLGESGCLSISFRCNGALSVKGGVYALHRTLHRIGLGGRTARNHAHVAGAGLLAGRTAGRGADLSATGGGRFPVQADRRELGSDRAQVPNQDKMCLEGRRQPAGVRTETEMGQHRRDLETGELLAV